MSAPPFLIFGLSRPTQVSETLWVEWYKKERLPQLVEMEIATRATVYREIPFPGLPPPNFEHDFLVLVQTKCEKGHDTPGIATLPQASDLFLQESDDTDLMKNHYSEVRDYELIQDYYPNPRKTGPPAHVLTIEMQPHDEADFDKWYREEHIPILSRVPGYHRSSRYRWHRREKFNGKENPAPYLALHEVEDAVQFLGSKEAIIANTSPWTAKQSKNNERTVARAWQKMATVGH